MTRITTEFGFRSNEATVVDRRGNDAFTTVAPYALKLENADRLWEESIRLLG